MGRFASCCRSAPLSFKRSFSEISFAISSWRKHIGELAVVLLTPNLAIVLRVDKLHADRKTITTLSHPAREHRLHF